jgi:hypothetical protein
LTISPCVVEKNIGWQSPAPPEIVLDSSCEKPALLYVRRVYAILRRLARKCAKTDNPQSYSKVAENDGKKIYDEKNDGEKIKVDAEKVSD